MTERRRGRRRRQMNNNSRKNNKNAKKISKNKRNSKKNFIIENLEPRWGASASLYSSEMKTNKFVFASLALLVVMDASAGYDIDKIEEYVNQFDSITVSTEENSLSSH